MTKPKWIIVAGHVYDNVKSKARLLGGNLETPHGATHYGWPVEKSLAYINEVFCDYLEYSRLPPKAIRGWRVLEIGPGDNLGVALNFLAAGAAQVVCIDKFHSKRDEAQQMRIYRALRGTYSGEERQRFDEAISLDDGITLNPRRLQYLSGTAIEEAKALFSPGSFDLIVSRAVLMEIADCDRAFATMNHLLRPGGRLIHKIAPLRDYEMFRANGYHPLEFLTIPEHLYACMVSDCGKPNRRLISYYRSKMRDLNYSATTPIVNLLGNSKFAPYRVMPPQSDPGYRKALSLVRAIRPRLAKQFRSCPDEDLMIEDFFLVAQKPACKTVANPAVPELAATSASLP